MKEHNVVRYTGPKAKLFRREGTDPFPKSARRSLADKCKLDDKSGRHDRISGARTSDYGNRPREKQKVKRIYGVLECQFHRYSAEADRRKDNMGETLLRLLEPRSDNIVYHMGSGSTRAEARQLVSHKAILVNGQALNVPSAQIKTGGAIVIREKSKRQVCIAESLTLAEQTDFPTWAVVDVKKMEDTLKQIPGHVDTAGDINENLIVELYLC